MKPLKLFKTVTIVALVLIVSLNVSKPAFASEDWYIKPAYIDYAQSGMPDFDQRQDSWYWRAWAYPDAVAVWQHFDAQYNDWDIYYSIYTDPNMWWTMGFQPARPIVADSAMQMPFLAGDDKQPAISWYSSNYAICVWQHWTGNDWEIMYSLFTPNVGWTAPSLVANLPSINDYDPAIAFDTNGWGVVVWVHGTQPGPTVIYYSVWNPNIMGWIGPANLLGAGQWPGKAAMPEVDIDSLHNAVTIWTDIPVQGQPGQEMVYYSWVALTPPMPPFPAWTAPAAIPGCPQGVNWQKGISPDNMGNNLVDFGLPAPIPGGEPLFYAQFTSPVKMWTIPSVPMTAPWTNGEHPDVAYDLNNKAIAVYTSWPNGQIFFSYWNGLNWAPVGGAFAASANAIMDQWPAICFIKNNKAVIAWNAYPEPGGPGWVSEIFYSVYTGPYPPGSWTQAAQIVPQTLIGDDYYVDIASPTGSPTTPPSVPPDPPAHGEPDWTYCGPTAVANSLWWFDSKYEPNNVPPPEISDKFPLVKSYQPLLWDDHDPNNVQPFIQHLAWLMDTDGQRTKLCHQGTTVWDMQAGITQYLSWSGVNPLGDVNGDGIVDQTDLGLVNFAMGSSPGMAGWNLAADIYPETLTGPGTADNIIDNNDLNLVNQNLGQKGMFYEHTTGLYPDFFYIEEEVEKCQDVVLLLAFFRDGIRVGGHFVTVAGVNSTMQQLLISNPIRDDFEAGLTQGRSPVPHLYPHGPEVHNNASLVSHDAYTVILDQAGGYWKLYDYFMDPQWEARIEFAVITSPYKRDVALTNVEAPAIVNRGDTSTRPRINVTVLNEGQLTETFNVTAYASNLLNTFKIGEQTVNSLPPSAQMNLAFQWTTTGWMLGNYTVWAYATPVPGEEIADQADNTCTDGEAILKNVGDLGGGTPPTFFNFDHSVNGMDLALFIQCYKGTAPAKAKYLGDLGGGMPPAFFAYDGKVDGTDLALFILCYKGQGP